MSISRLRSGEKYSYRNQVIAFSQAINTFTNDLPQRLTDAGILGVKKPGIENPHRDFVVRRDNVLDASTWLKENNPSPTVMIT